MYVVDTQDAVVELAEVPACDVGAPCPVIVASEQRLFLAYVGGSLPTSMADVAVHVVDPQTQADAIVVVEFSGYIAHYQGPPNDEAFGGHPLAGRGLRPYGAFEIRHSSWIRTLERMNRVHPDQQAERFLSLRHFVWSFHDTTFECVAEAYRVRVQSGAMAAVLPELVRRLGHDAPAT